MDEISIVNLLNTIKSKTSSFQWQLTCKYDNGKGVTVMEITFFDQRTNGNFGKVIYKNTSGEVIQGNYKNLPPFEKGMGVMDAILDIMNFENA
ncbi:MAG: hypothetical protein NXI20_04445 [bacterium]|nr:hypothetical protein [bacterium]